MTELTPSGGDDTQHLADFLARCGKSGDEGWIGPGIYRIDPLSHTLTGDVVVRCSPKARFAYKTAGARAALLTLRSNRKYGVTWTGATFDTKDGTFTDSKASNTGMSLIGLADFRLRDVRYDAGPHWSMGMGDSAISFNSCGHGVIEACEMRGFSDLGIYAGGGANADSEDDDGEGAIIHGCRFFQCHIAASNKRRGNALNISQCKVYGGRYGFLTQQVSTVRAGQRNVIVGNELYDVAVNAIGLRDTSGAIVANNLIEGFGFEDGKPVTNVTPTAIRLEAAVASSVHGNVIDSAHEGAIAVECIDFEGKTSRNNQALGNMVAKRIKRHWHDPSKTNHWRSGVRF